PASQQREEVDAQDEGVEDLLGPGLALRPGDPLRRGEQQGRGDEELRQDVAHPVEREALAALVADDVGDLARQPGPVRGWCHGLLACALPVRCCHRLLATLPHRPDPGAYSNRQGPGGHSPSVCRESGWDLWDIETS